jgi:hypothetical protein
MSTPPKVIETDKFLIKIYEKKSYLEYCIAEGATIDVEAAEEGKKRITELSPGLKFYVLAEGYNFFTLTIGARKLCATKEFSDNTIAIAFYTTNISLLLLGEMYLKINKPVVSTKIFSNRDTAKEWLNEQMRINGLQNQIEPNDHIWS